MRRARRTLIFGEGLCAAISKCISLLTAGGTNTEGQRAQTLALYPPDPSISRSLRPLGASAPSRLTPSARDLNFTFHDGHGSPQRIRVPYNERALYLTGGRAYLCAPLLNKGRTLTIGALPVVRGAVRHKKQGCAPAPMSSLACGEAALDGAEGAVRRKERERDGVEGWRVGSGDPPSFHIFTE